MSSRTAVVILGEQEYEVKALRIKHLKKLAKFMVLTVSEFKSLLALDDEAAVAAFDALLDKPEQFIKRLAPDLPDGVVDEAYLDELAEAVKVLWELQGINKLKGLADPLREMLVLATGELPQEMQVPEPGTTSTPNSSSISDEEVTISTDGKSIPGSEQ